MPLTYDQIKERFEDLGKSLKNQLDQAGYTNINARNEIARPKILELQEKICKELQEEYKVSYYEACFIASHITENKSSSYVFSTIKLHNLDEAGLKLTNLFTFRYWSLSLEDAAREASLIEDKTLLYNHKKSIFIKALISAPESPYKSIAEIANTLSKYPSITDEQLLHLLSCKEKFITSGKITLDEILQKTAEYGVYALDANDTNKTPSSSTDSVKVEKPYSFIESVKEFFGFKSSSVSIETSPQDLQAPELIENSHNTDSNE